MVVQQKAFRFIPKPKCFMLFDATKISQKVFRRTFMHDLALLYVIVFDFYLSINLVKLQLHL